MLSVLLVATVGWIHRQGELHAEDIQTDSCVASSKPHKKPLPLEFCEWHVKDACCTPMHDAAAQEFYVGLTQLGLPCAHATHAIKHRYLRLRYWGCLACDPHEPLYRYRKHLGYPPNNILPEPVSTPTTLIVADRTDAERYLFTEIDGDYESGNNTLYYSDDTNSFVLNLTNGRVIYSKPAKIFRNSPNFADWSDTNITVIRTDPVPYQFSWRVCRSFLEGMWNGRGDVEDRNGHLFDDCGMIINEEGVIPSALFKGPTAAFDFISQIPPPNFDHVGGFQFVVIDDVSATPEACSLCTPDPVTSMCLNCSNGCTYSNEPSGPTCLGFNSDITPCFLGEDTALPGSFGTMLVPNIWFMLVAVIVVVALAS